MDGLPLHQDLYNRHNHPVNQYQLECSFVVNLIQSPVPDHLPSQIAPKNKLPILNIVH